MKKLYIPYRKSMKLMVYIISVVIISLCMVGCENLQPVTYLSEDIRSNKTDVYDIKQISDFKTVDAQEILDGSVELPYYEGYMFIPTRFTNDGWVLGVLTNLDDNTEKYFAYYDVNTNDYHKVMKLEAIEFASVGFLEVNDKYIVFRESVSAHINKNRFYIYDIEKQTYDLMIEINDIPLLLIPCNINKDKVYIGLPGANYSYVIYEYDITNKSLITLIEETSDENNQISLLSPIQIDNDIYYIRNNKNLETSEFMKMNLDTKEVETVYKFSMKDDNEQIYILKSDKNKIFMYVEKYPLVICYEYDVEEDILKPFFKNIGISNPILAGEFMVWGRVGTSEDRIHPREFLFDYVNQINYDYYDSLIMASNKGIIWVKYLIDEKEIPKGELYRSEYTTMMYKEF